MKTLTILSKKEVGQVEFVEWLAVNDKMYVCIYVCTRGYLFLEAMGLALSGVNPVLLLELNTKQSRNIVKLC